MAVWSIGQSLRSIGCTPALSVTQKAPMQLQYAVRRAKYCKPLCHMTKWRYYVCQQSLFCGESRIRI